MGHVRCDLENAVSYLFEPRQHRKTNVTEHLSPIDSHCAVASLYSLSPNGSSGARSRRRVVRSDTWGVVGGGMIGTRRLAGRARDRISRACCSYCFVAWGRIRRLGPLPVRVDRMLLYDARYLSMGTVHKRRALLRRLERGWRISRCVQSPELRRSSAL